MDCVTYIVCSSVALDVGGESIPYIAGWGEDGELDAIRDYAASASGVIAPFGGSGFGAITSSMRRAIVSIVAA